MCHPAFLIASALLSSAGALQQGMVQSANLKAQAAGLERQADSEQVAAGYEANRRKEQLAALTGQQITAVGADGGGDLSGSVVDVIGNSRREGLLDVAAVEYGAAVRSGNLRAEAKVARSNAKSAKIGAIIGAATPLLALGGNDKVVKLGQNLFK